MQSHHFYQNTNTNIQQICKRRLAKKKVLTKPYKKKQSETTSIPSKIPRAVFLTCHDIFIHWLKWKSPNTNLCLPPFQHFSVAAKYFIYFFFSPQKDLPGQPLLKSTKNFLNFQYLKYQSILSKGTHVFPRDFQKLQKQLLAPMRGLLQYILRYESGLTFCKTQAEANWQLMVKYARRPLL